MSLVFLRLTFISLALPVFSLSFFFPLASARPRASQRRATKHRWFETKLKLELLPSSTRSCREIAEVARERQRCSMERRDIHVGSNYELTQVSVRSLSHYSHGITSLPAPPISIRTCPREPPLYIPASVYYVDIYTQAAGEEGWTRPVCRCACLE